MKENLERPARNEIIERYCHVIDRNTVIVSSGDSCPVCVNRQKCEMNGGCKNDKYNQKGNSIG